MGEKEHKNLLATTSVSCPGWQELYRQLLEAMQQRDLWKREVVWLRGKRHAELAEIDWLRQRIRELESGDEAPPESFDEGVNP